MAGAFALLAVVLCASVLEGLWTWLLASALAELDGQVSPSLAAMGLLIAASWLTARLLATARVSLPRQRLILIVGGLALALSAGTIHAGLIHPVQLVTGHHDPDYRGSGAAVAVLVAYLWGRGLGLAARVNRQRVVSHIGVSAFLLANILLVLPLTRTVHELGLATVVASFLLAVTALLLLQLGDTESRQLSKWQWAAVGGGATVGLVLLGGVLVGVLSSGGVNALGQAIGRTARFASPLSDTFLLGVGYLAQYLTYFLIWLRQLYGGDPEAVQRAQEQAEEARFRFESEGSYGPPEIMTLIAVIFAAGLAIFWFAHFFARMVGLGQRTPPNDIFEERESVLRGPGTGLLRSAWHRLADLRAVGSGELAGRAGAIRQHYRAFQALMARAELPRTESQTPQEYQSYLARTLPSAQAPVGAITNAYVLARYAGPETALPDPDLVAGALRQVRESLRLSSSVPGTAPLPAEH